mmetsp:Transcript_28484/g.60681  ORF Transcript_28484/g.60681 Transcript_28484/m.60681 type:complete len:147 (+) Transcript_28484:393-833(+)
MNCMMRRKMSSTLLLTIVMIVGDGEVNGVGGGGNGNVGGKGVELSPEDEDVDIITIDVEFLHLTVILRMYWTCFILIPKLKKYYQRISSLARKRQSMRKRVLVSFCLPTRQKGPGKKCDAVEAKAQAKSMYCFIVLPELETAMTLH